ncbi:hypothetical protein M4S82_02620 [Planococcus sp. MERTA32b]|nr:hypothetical protein [Planococcus sp. MER TA 32b]
MKRSSLQKIRSFYGSQFKRKLSPTLGKEGYLGTLEICMPAFHEKKFGTSATAKSSQNHSAALSPPPICPMVEKYPYHKLKQTGNKAHKQIEECV